MAEIAGLKLIVPTSVTATGGCSASASATGKITFSGVRVDGTFTVEGAFSADYDNYLFVWGSLVGDNGTLQMRMRVSGSDASGSDYARQTLNADSTSVTAARATSQTNVRIAQLAGTTLYGGYHSYVYGPYLAQPTAFRTVGCHADFGGRIIDVASTHSLSTSYTGFTIFGGDSSPRVAAGTLQIFGLSQ